MPCALGFFLTTTAIILARLAVILVSGNGDIRQSYTGK